MKMMTKSRLAMLVAVVLLAGCGSSVELAEPPVETRIPRPTAATPGSGSSSALSAAAASGVTPGSASASAAPRHQQQLDRHR
ncbi:MAG: hypothetical protein Q8N44_14165, partial [Rubrivivax sp.]|nr:hypothetical protein [Rubrivivax sp.]